MNKSEQLRESTGPRFLRASATARPIGVDRKENVLRGFVVAQLGPFKSEGRGEFDQFSLDEIVRLGNSTGQLKSRFNHPTMCDDGLGKFLGRPRGFFMSTATTSDGKTVPAVRADLQFDRTALDTPPDGGKPLGVYVMDLAESDPDALSSSLVLRVNKEYRVNSDGTRQRSEDGEELPPLWRPVRLFGSDIVDTGDAVDGLLSAGDGPDAVVWKAAEFLDAQFPDAAREELADRLGGWLARYLDMRFGPDEKAGGFIFPDAAAADDFTKRLAEHVAKPAAVAADPASAPAELSAGADVATLARRQRQRELECGIA